MSASRPFTLPGHGRLCLNFWFECFRLLHMCKSIEQYEREIDELRKKNQKLGLEISELRKQLAIVKELRRELADRNSKNSSVPPSSDFKSNSSQPYDKGGARPGHSAQLRKLLGMERVDVTHVHTLDECPACGCKRLVPRAAAAPFQFIELVDGRCIVAQHERTRYRCCSCQRRFSTPLPEDVGPSNYGPKFHAAIAMLTGHFHLSKRQVAEFTDQFFGIAISDGTVCRIERRVTQALSGVYEQVAGEVQLSSTTKFVDETRWRDQRRNGYVWAAVGKSFSFFKITYSRCRVSRDQLLGSNYASPTVTDRYCVYSDLAIPHQYCLAHLKRDFTRFAESRGNPRWIANGLIRELDGVFHQWHLFQKEAITRKQLITRTYYRRQRIQSLLEIGEAEPLGKFHRFCRGLLDRYDRLWTYLRVADMEPTNNHAERSLRPLVLLRRKSLGTKSIAGMAYVATITTVCQTLRKQGRKILNFMTACIQGLDPILI